ncbi:MAG: malic enzyme-like NAD(P)-binding protein, partial [Ilumatobacteraceae bacterium]
VYVFPGLGLGVIASGATEVTADMVTAASLAVAEFASATETPSLVPPIEQSHAVALAVADAVARQAMLEGVAAVLDEDALAERIRVCCWYPGY